MRECHRADILCFIAGGGTGGIDLALPTRHSCRIRGRKSAVRPAGRIPAQVDLTFRLPKRFIDDINEISVLDSCRARMTQSTCSKENEPCGHSTIECCSGARYRSPCGGTWRWFRRASRSLMAEHYGLVIRHRTDHASKRLPAIDD